MAHPGGRPLKFSTVADLQEKIDAYFAMCDPHPEERGIYEYPKKKVKGAKGKMVEEDDKTQKPSIRYEWSISHQQPYTVTGLANFLETSRETLINYEKRDEFFDTIKAAKDKCEHYWELQLLGSHATGPIFNLKNNYGWKDKTEQDITSAGDKLELPVVRIIDERQRNTDT